MGQALKGTTTLNYDAKRTLTSPTGADGHTTKYTAQQAATMIDTSSEVGTQWNPAALVPVSAAVSTQVDSGNAMSLR